MKKLFHIFALCAILSFSIVLSAQAANTNPCNLIEGSVAAMLDRNGASYITLLSGDDFYDHQGNFNLGTYLGNGPVDITVLGGSAGNSVYLKVGTEVVYTKSGSGIEWYPDGLNAKMILENVILSDIFLGFGSAEARLGDSAAYEPDPQGKGSQHKNKLQGFMLLEDFMFGDTLFKAGTLIVGYEDSVDSDFNDIVIAIAPTAQTPIPGVALLLGSGLAGLGMIRRKMK